MITIDEQIFALSEAELDAFPHGIIRLDRGGTILYYNDSMSAISGLLATNVVGRNFFREVAPCAAVKNFQGRFNEFVRTSGSRIEQFAFDFRFSWGDKAVKITLVRRVGDEERIYIVVNAKSLAP